MFDGVSARNPSLYNAMFKGYIQHQMHQEVVDLFNDMMRENVGPNCYTFPMVLKSCGKLMAITEGELVHSVVVKVGFLSNNYVGTTLIDVYSSWGRVGTAYRVFNELTVRNVVSWTSMITGFVSGGDLVAARRLFNLAPDKDAILWNIMMSGYIECGDMTNAKMLFDLIPHKDIISWNTLLNGYGKNKDVEACEKLFQEMPHRNIFSWNALIGGYATSECFSEVIGAFKRMLNEADVQPDDATLVNVLSACARLGALDMGKWLHKYAKNNGYEDNIFVCNALIEMYGKCGAVESAMGVFRKMGKKDLITWNSMINVLALHGHGVGALDLYSEMRSAGERPDGITYVGILSACSHLGLVDDGFKYFLSMVDKYSIVPQIEHYGCMVDILTRAGLLKHAVDFVQNMPIKADAIIWTTLLGACRVHKNIDFAELALQKLIEIDPENPANYLMLGNIYGAAKRWEDLARLKMATRDTGSKKLPGCSLIEVDNNAVEFYSYDERHSRTEEIYAALRGLNTISCLYMDFQDLGPEI